MRRNLFPNPGLGLHGLLPGSVVMERRRTKQVANLETRLAAEAKRLREEAEVLQPGAIRDEMLRKARQCETGSHMSDWLRSPGLQAPE